MKLVIIFLLVSFQIGQTATFESKLEEAFKSYTQGDYDSVLAIMTDSEKNYKLDKGKRGLIHYWKALSAAKLFDFNLSISEFEKAINLKFNSKDIFYEYGQALYGKENYRLARKQFAKSIKNNYKKAVSTYYLAYCSQQLKDYKTAVKFYKKIEKMKGPESQVVIQPAMMQIGDIYLEQVEKTTRNTRSIESIVIPQFEKAYDHDSRSRLAPKISSKIDSLKQKYELILFKMRNGRPTQRPPYILRGTVGTTYNSNVNSVNESSYDAADDAAPSLDVSVLARYTFYLKDFFSTAPGVNLNYSKYLSDKSAIYSNNSLSKNIFVRNAYEHMISKYSATTLFDIDYTMMQADSQGLKELSDFSNSTSIMIGERLGLSPAEEIIFRFFHTKNDVIDNKNQNTTSNRFSLESSFLISRYLLISLLSYEMKSGDERDLLDVDTLQFRNDVILPKMLWFTPTIGLDFQMLNYKNIADQGGDVRLSPSLNLSRSLYRGLRLSFDLNYRTYMSDSAANEFTSWTGGLRLEYSYL